jgi:predicted ATPase
MLKDLVIRAFKSIRELNLELGQINVFIGANGSGKSNLLESLGVLGAAAFGRVDDETLLRRGVRPGVPRLYKSAFPGAQQGMENHILFEARNSVAARYAVTLWNPIEKPNPA